MKFSAATFVLTALSTSALEFGTRNTRGGRRQAQSDKAMGLISRSNDDNEPGTRNRQLESTDKTVSSDKEANFDMFWRTSGCDVRNTLSFSAKIAAVKIVADNGAVDKRLNNYAFFALSLWSDCDETSAKRTTVDVETTSGKRTLLAIGTDADSATFDGDLSVTLVTETCTKVCDDDECWYGDCSAPSSASVVVNVDATWMAKGDIIPTSSRSIDTFRNPDYSGRQRSNSLGRPASATVAISFDGVALDFPSKVNINGYLQVSNSSNLFTMA